MGIDDLWAGLRQVGTPQCSSSALRWGFRAGPGPDGVGGEHNVLGKGGNTEWRCPVESGRLLEGPAPGVQCLLLNSPCPK